MADQQLKDYIDQQLSKGASKEQINEFLIKSGWNQNDIDSALKNKDSEMSLPPPPPPPTNSNVKNTLGTRSNPTMWDTFAHVILFISLYVVATAGGLILHFIIDSILPESAGTSTFANLRAETINWYLASLIVATPIFCVAFIDITKRTSKNPHIRNLGIRKIFIYITLIITFLYMLYHVTSSVYSVLSGNISLNAFLHLAVNISIPAVIFGYLAFQVRGDRELND